MNEPIHEEPSGMLRRWAPGMALSTVATAGLWVAAGNSLGLWLGGFALAALLAPWLAMGKPARSERALSIGTSVDPVAGVWLISALLVGIPLSSWLACAALLYATALAFGGLALLARAAGLPMGLAAPLAVILGCAWLSAPVWAPAYLSSGAVERMCAVHPLLAANARLTGLGIWLEHAMVYRHTMLGQDIAYQLPSSVMPSIFLHLPLGVLGILVMPAHPAPRER